MVESAQQTASVPVEFICYIDDDDASYEGTFSFPGFNIRFRKGSRITLSDTWNKCAEWATGDIFLQGNDDIIFRTPNWDTMVENEFAAYKDKILLVHGDDGSGQMGTSAPHPFVHRKWFETLGYFTPAFFSSDHGDTWICEIARAVGRMRKLPFLIEHMHVVWGKAEMDETTTDRLARHSADNVDQLYADLAPLRQLDIEKLKAAML